MSKRIRVKHSGTSSGKPIGTVGLKVHADPDSVRALHVKAYKAQLSSLNKAKEKMRQYVEVDEPAFSLWWQKEFQRELMQHIELEKTYNDLQLLIDAIEHYRDHYGVSYQEAEAVVSKAHAAGKLSAVMQTIFEEIDALRAKQSGRRKTKKHDFEGEDFFQNLFDEMNSRTEADEEAEGERRGRSSRANDAQQDTHTQTRSYATRAEDTIDDYLKKIYRDLVRLLHPDANAGRAQTAEEKRLWFEVQSAYEWRDMERLEQIFQAVKGGGELAIDFAIIPIADIVAMREALEKNLKLVNKDIRQAKKAPVWDFQLRSKKKSFLKYLSQGFQEELEEQTMMYKMRIDVLREQLELWRKGRKPRRR